MTQQCFKAQLVYGDTVKETVIWAANASEAWEKLHFKHDFADVIYIMVDGQRTRPGMVITEEVEKVGHNETVAIVNTVRGMMQKWDMGTQLDIVCIVESSGRDEEVNTSQRLQHCAVVAIHSRSSYPTDAHCTMKR